MLDAYARIFDTLADFATAQPVQTVHDSVVIECDFADAHAVADRVRDALERASRQACPDVTPKVDVDIRTSLAESDLVSRLKGVASASHRV